MEVRSYQKKNCLIYEIFYINLMVTTKQTIRAESQIIKRKLRKPSQKTTKLKWHQEIQGKRNNENKEQQENEVKWQH